MKILNLIVILFSSTLLYGQESDIYKNNGRLIIDSSYAIDQNRIQDFLKIEKFVLPLIYNRLEYPNSSKLSIEGTVIAKLTIDENNSILVKLIKTADVSLSKSVLTALDTSFLKRELIGIKSPFEFYLPFKFEVLNDTFKKDLKSYNSIIIRASTGAAYYENIGIQK